MMSVATMFNICSNLVDWISSMTPWCWHCNSTNKSCTGRPYAEVTDHVLSYTLAVLVLELSKLLLFDLGPFSNWAVAPVRYC